MRSRTKTTASALAAAALIGGGLTACVPGDGRASDIGSQARAAQSPSPSASAPASGSPTAKGGSLADRSGPEILTEAYEATRKAESAHVNAKVEHEGKPMRIDLSLDKKGNCNGSIRLDGMGRLDIIKSSELVHFRGDAAYWRGAAKQKHAPQKQTDQMVAMLADRWVRIPASDPRAAPMTGSCDLDKLTGDFGTAHPLARKGTASTVDGKPALAVTSPAKQGTQTDYVSTQGKPYILKSTVQGDTAGEALFSAFDTPVDTTSPKDSDVLDISKLGGPTGEAV
ncbi:hypothetical protein [Streptomyces sp. NBC_00091]|uniref:hypothetical protein n=1 Tax=Streptomyces sp. NBC_00091 TaxID=2975648 RepID=UPI002256423D|nr:hypothetical protein [Streptomyces sp. NBC_00091]MCX5377949.1 hypothetical protein [Streptomyces sp. NBC_00091]